MNEPPKKPVVCKCGAVYAGPLPETCYFCGEPLGAK